ncbi:hypothetical protein A2U01_0115085, partial [Trifolium medium]|nr:hypothetical protein [Trifolium medium]
MSLLFRITQAALSPDPCRSLTYLGVYILVVTSGPSLHQHHNNRQLRARTELQVSSSIFT